MKENEIRETIEITLAGLQEGYGRFEKIPGADGLYAIRKDMQLLFVFNTAAIVADLLVKSTYAPELFSGIDITALQPETLKAIEAEIVSRHNQYVDAWSVPAHRMQAGPTGVQ